MRGDRRGVQLAVWIAVGAIDAVVGRSGKRFGVRISQKDAELLQVGGVLNGQLVVGLQGFALEVDELTIERQCDNVFIEEAAEAIENYGWYNRSCAVNPYLVEGKKTVAFEICEQLGFRAPDKVFIPVGDGCITSGVAKGFAGPAGDRPDR